MYIAKWHDNPVAKIANNWETHEPVRKVRQRINGEAKEATQSHFIGSYKKGMCGVDLMDRLLESYRPKILGKNGTGHGS